MHQPDDSSFKRSYEVYSFKGSIVHKLVFYLIILNNPNSFRNDLAPSDLEGSYLHCSCGPPL